MCVLSYPEMIILMKYALHDYDKLVIRILGSSLILHSIKNYWN